VRTFNQPPRRKVAHGHWRRRDPSLPHALDFDARGHRPSDIAALAGLASAVAEFANAGEARQTINSLGFGDVVVVASQEWLRRGAFVTPTGVAVGLMMRTKQGCSKFVELHGASRAIPANSKAEMARKMVTELAADRSFVIHAPNLLDFKLNRLSSCQREILELMARGFFNKQIAEELGLTISTVKGQVSHILTRLPMAHPGGRRFPAEIW
jgi:hypothetical protein